MNKTPIELNIKIELEKSENYKEFSDLPDPYINDLVDKLEAHKLHFVDEQVSCFLTPEGREGVGIKIESWRDEDLGIQPLELDDATRKDFYTMISCANKGASIYEMELSHSYAISDLYFKDIDDKDAILGVVEVNKNKYEFSYDEEIGRINSICRENEQGEKEQDDVPALLNNNYAVYQIESAIAEELDYIRENEKEFER